ncbi:MAG: type II secretion system protein, partial [Planctomycetota bacterium]
MRPRGFPVNTPGLDLHAPRLAKPAPSRARPQRRPDPMKNNHVGFTLIELLVVMSILSLLVVALLPM